MPDESTGLTSQREDRPDKTVSISWRPLCLILVLSLGIRVWWLMNKVTVIEGEGANYARLAENLATGKGWVGTGGQADLFYPPLFSLFIAGAFRALHNAELAGRLISISFGMLLIIPIFLISREIYYQAVGYIAALIAALHPFFVSVSATVYAESTYSFFLFMGIYYGIRSARRLSSREAIMAGLMLGLAYLTRPEALMTACFVFLLILLLGLKHPHQAIRAAACLLLTCALTGAPYVWFLKVHTGQFRLEGKSANNYAFGEMRLAGFGWEEAYRKVDDRLNPVGLSMRTELDVLRTTTIDLSKAVRLVKLAGPENSRRIVHDLLEERAAGGFVLVGLVSLGLFASPWDRKRALQEALALVYLVCLFLPLLSVAESLNTRYILSFLVVVIIWAARGVSGFADWAEVTLGMLARPLRWVRPARAIGMATAVGALFLVTGPAIKHVDNLRGGDPAMKTAGLLLKERCSGPLVVMDTDNRIAYYSGAVYKPYPYASQNTALRWIAANNVNVLVIKERNAETNNPYYHNWITEGIPDPRASLLLSVPSEDFGRILLYRLR